MNKIARIALPVVAITFFIGTVGADEKSGKPFQALWDAISNLQLQIDALEEDGGEHGGSRTVLHLYDASGQDLGIVIGTNMAGTDFTTYNQGIDGILEFSQTRSPGYKLAHLSSTGGVRFTDENCTGQAYVHSYGAPHGIAVANGRIFRYTPDDPMTGLQSKSVWQSGGCRNVVRTDDMGAFVEEITAPFSLPLTWPLQVRLVP